MKESEPGTNAEEGVVGPLELWFMKYILPYDSQITVLKTEGESVETKKVKAKLPKGFNYVRVTAKGSNIPDFGIDIRKLGEKSAKHQTLPVSTLSGTEDEIHSAPDRIESHINGNQQYQYGFFSNDRHKTYHKSSNNERVFTDQNDESMIKEKDPDSRGYFKALNLSIVQALEGDAEEISKRIKSAYRKAASVAHPDHGGSNEAMKLVNRAFEVVSNPALRSDYIGQKGEFRPPLN